jgi:purine-binding chemotaxis protein CheW
MHSADVADLADNSLPGADTSRPGSTLRLVVFGIESQRYALRLPVVERVLRMVEVSPLPKAPAIVLGVINFHGQIIPVLDLQRRLGLSSNHYGLASCLLVARTSRRILAVPINQVLGVQEVAAETVTLPDAVFPGIGLVAGIVALADGVLFIHDPDTCLSPDEEQRLTAALEGERA